ncbi:DUF4129 domain-containing protein [Rubrivirga sp.]|uniref:DUF4129 domain-containing protein n=1 Tax=Rubrivirga sp. TaxID=1885344 RepID=UPI003C756DC0
MRSVAGGMIVALCASVQAQSPAAPPPPPASVLEVARDTAAVPTSTAPLEQRAVPDIVERYRADPDFKYADPEVEGPSLWDRFWSWLERTFWDPIYDSTTAEGRDIILVLVAVVALGWVVARLLRTEGSFGVLARRDRDAPGVGLLDVDDIAQVDLEARLRDALAASDYRQAVRVRYLAVLQDLDAAGALEWRRDKTNRQYVLEVGHRSPDLADSFRKTTRVFDAVWYGERPVSASRYDRLVPLFEAAAPREVAA